MNRYGIRVVQNQVFIGLLGSLRADPATLMCDKNVVCVRSMSGLYYLVRANNKIGRVLQMYEHVEHPLLCCLVEIAFDVPIASEDLIRTYPNSRGKFSTSAMNKTISQIVHNGDHSIEEGQWRHIPELKISVRFWYNTTITLGSEIDFNFARIFDVSAIHDKGR